MATTSKTTAAWTKERFEKRIKLEYGSSLPEAKRTPGPYPVYGSNGAVGNHSASLIKAPGIVVGRKGTIGAVTWVDSDFWPIDTTYYVTHDESIELRWLFYKLQALGLTKMNSASGTPGLNREEVYKLEVEIPSKAEQNKISAILSTIDEDIQKDKELILQSKKLKKGLMKHLFTQKTATSSKLKDIASIFSGGTPPKKHAEFWEGEVPWVSPKDMKGLGIQDSQDHIAESARAYAGNASLNDILIVVRSGILVHHVPISLVGRSLSFNQDIKGLTVLNKDELLPAFLFQYLLFKEGDLLRQGVKRGTTVHSVNTDYLEQMLIPLPNMEKQEEVAKILTLIDKKVALQTRMQKQKLLLKKAVMQDLLSGSKRV